jgi:hypothetical protein
LLKSRKLEENKEETKKCVEELDVQGFTRRVLICKFTVGFKARKRTCSLVILNTGRFKKCC